MVELTQKRLKELLYYNPQFGIFVWINQRKRGVKGSIAGRVNHTGYVQIGIDNKRHSAHRLAFLYVHGRFPLHEVDHINHNKSDNRLCNLREVTKKENSKNRPCPSSNTSGYMGVNFVKKTGKWRAGIRVDGEQKNIGDYSSKSDAISARARAEIEYKFHINHGEKTTEVV